MRRTLVALLGCALLVAVFVPLAIGAEAEPTLNHAEQQLAATNTPESSAALLAVQALEVTPMTDTELDQIIGAAPIIMTIGVAPTEIIPGFSIGVESVFELDLGTGQFDFSIGTLLAIAGSLDLF